ncbi:MAG: hypothetical protein R3F61_18380 [Myxococcota bacterium]
MWLFAILTALAGPQLDPEPWERPRRVPRSVVGRADVRANGGAMSSTHGALAVLDGRVRLATSRWTGFQLWATRTTWHNQMRGLMGGAQAHLGVHWTGARDGSRSFAGLTVGLGVADPQSPVALPAVDAGILLRTHGPQVLWELEGTVTGASPAGLIARTDALAGVHVAGPVHVTVMGRLMWLSDLRGDTSSYGGLAAGLLLRDHGLRPRR